MAFPRIPNYRNLPWGPGLAHTVSTRPGLEYTYRGYLNLNSDSATETRRAWCWGRKGTGLTFLMDVPNSDFMKNWSTRNAVTDNTTCSESRKSAWMISEIAQSGCWMEPWGRRSLEMRHWGARMVYGWSMGTVKWFLVIAAVGGRQRYVNDGKYVKGSEALWGMLGGDTLSAWVLKGQVLCGSRIPTVTFVRNGKYRDPPLGSCGLWKVEDWVSVYLRMPQGREIIVPMRELGFRQGDEMEGWWRGLWKAFQRAR